MGDNVQRFQPSPVALGLAFLRAEVLRPLVPRWRIFRLSCGALGTDKYPEAQIYALDERRGLFRRPAKDPIQLTSGPIEWSPPVFSKDGKKIFATGSTKRGELVRFDPKSNQFQPFLGGISADLVAFSKDGQSVAYVTYPEEILWRANRDGSDRVQLTSPPLRRYRSLGHQMAANRLRGAVSEGPSKRGSSPPRVAVHSGFFLRTAGRRQSRAGRRTGARLFSPRASWDSRELHTHPRPRQPSDHTLPGSAGKFPDADWSPDGESIKAESLDLPPSMSSRRRPSIGRALQGSPRLSHGGQR